MRLCVLFTASVLLSSGMYGQFEPESAHVNLYFPHLADGGTPAQRWQTGFIFVNPSSETTATVALVLHANDGGPLALDLGQGLSSSHSFSIPPQGRVSLRSSIASPTILTGWAVAYASIPVQATLIFRELIGTTPVVDLTTPATLPSHDFRFAANRNLGIALANIYSIPVSATLTALGANGASLGSVQVSIPALGHSTFNLWQVLPSLPSDYLGSVEISTDTPSYVFLAWTCNEDSGLLSTLPPGGLAWPISHWDRIWLVYKKALQAARTAYPSVNFDSPPVTLAVTPRLFPQDCGRPPGPSELNACAAPNGTVHIPYSISELMSDSESELGWLVAHELGHQVQYRSPGIVAPHRLYDPNVETDADKISFILALQAGFDPYAAAGALAKLAMTSGTAGLWNIVQGDFDTMLGGDPHYSYATRINNLWNLIVEVCADPAANQACSLYKSFIHPDFPVSVPLVRVPSPRSR